MQPISAKFFPSLLPAGILIGLLVFPSLPAGDDFCLECHADPELVRENDEGTLESLFVDPEEYRKSVHAGMPCLGCHDSFDESTHPGPLPEVGCGNCHMDTEEEFSESLHADPPLREGEKTPTPGCTDCHGIHGILPAWDSGSPIFRPRISLLCGRCHGDQRFVLEAPGLLSTRPFFAFQDSVHGRAIARGEIRAAVCTDCHGTHSLYLPLDPRSRISRWNIPETCGQCHRAVLSKYRESIHGKQAARGNSGVPVCTDCHGIHSILPHVDPESSVAEQAIARTTCPQCHAGERLSREYGVSRGRVRSYLDSYHGLAHQLGSVVVANCASCHGVHEILPSQDPRSTIHLDNLPKTCGKCHPGAGENFTRGPIHLFTGTEQGKTEAFPVNLVRALYLPLILITIGGMLLHNSLDFFRRALHPPALWPPGKTVFRMSLEQRLEHAVLMMSFLFLVITGFALKYPSAFWVELLHLEEAARRTLHRAAGTILVLLGFYHLATSLLTRYGRAELKALRPGLRDLREAVQQIAFNLGRRRAHPYCGRYRYEEKLEYWALIWGTVVMVVTGGILWFENFSLQFLPLWAMDVAAAVHLYEAWLATLAILVWHLYFVIFRPGVYPMNWTWITGRIPERMLQEEHPEEWEAQFPTSPAP